MGALALVCGAFAACSAAFAAPAALAAAPGGVAGLVREAATEAPIAGIEVCARSTAEPLAPLACMTTGSTGEYELAGLAEGQYHVSFSAPAKSGLNFLTQYFDGRSTEALADPVTVTEAVTTQKVNAMLQPGGEIKGGVTEGEGNPLAGIEVCAVEKGVEAPTRCVITKASGNYTIAGLAGGEYEVEFFAPPGYEPGYVTQFYNGAASRSSATAVTVTAGATAVKGVNAALEPVTPPTGAIAGTVSSAATSAPLPGVHVCALSIASSLETCTLTEAAGAYALPALAPGDYHVEFVPPEGGEAYELQWYKEKPSEAEAEVVTVTAGATTGAIDAMLRPAEAEPPPSTPVSLAKPSIFGTAEQGQTLIFTGGTWLYEPTIVADEWGRCASSGVIETCHTIATTPSYVLTAEDVGSTIRIREKAFNSFGEGQAFSRPTAVVAGLPAPAPTSTTPPSTPTPSGSSGVSPEIARAASSTQLKALLTKLLVPHGKAAKLAALQSRGSYVVTFGSLAAGRLSIAWYLVSKGARLSTAKLKPLLVASGKLTTMASGTAKLKIKLTASGRALLAKGKSLTLTAKGAFAPSGQPSLSAKRSFTLKR